MPLKTRDVVLLYANAEADSATEIQDIDLPDPISAFSLEVYCTNGATSNKGNYISDIVTRIEVVDGGETLWSLSGIQAQALQFYKTGKMPYIFPSEWDGGQQREQFMVLFGRYLWDRSYAFVPSSYRNPQIKVTFNKAAIRAAGATGFAAGTNIYLTITAKVMEQGASPVGFLSAQQAESWTTASSGDRRIDLPVDYPHSLHMFRSYLQEYDINEMASDLKLTADLDKYVILNRKVSQLDSEALARLGLFTYKHDVLVANPATIRVIPNKEPISLWHVRVPSTPRVIVAYAQWSSSIYTELYTLAGAGDATDREATGIVWGHSPHSTIPIYFGRYENSDDWLNLSGFKKFEAVITEATASGVGSYVVEQARPR